MLDDADNDFICKVGPGTPMGEAMRRFWWPVLLSEELPGPDADPIRIRLLGQNFVAFRDSEGRVGLLDERCSHRGASLALGRVEGCGIRCLYHGWKYDVEGRILDAPYLEQQILRDRVRQPAYPVREEGGFVWAYVGPPDQEPSFRRFFWMDLPSPHYSVRGGLFPCNYLAIIENGIDGPHVTVLHQDSLSTVSEMASGQPLNLPSEHRVPPRWEVEETEFGFYCAALREGKADGEAMRTWARVDALVMPTTAFVPPAFCSIAVPVDDETTIFFNVHYNVAGDAVRYPSVAEMFPDVFDEVPGRLLVTPKLTRDNGYLQDRAAMREGSFTGLPGGIGQEDAAIVLSMGSRPSRSIEHLAPYDIAVVSLRRRLADLARRVTEGEPLGSVVVDISGGP